MKIRMLARGITPYLTAYLLLVSLGLPLHKVYCACKGDSDLALLVSEHACHEEEKVADFNSEEERRSATLEELANVAKSSCCSKAKTSCTSDNEHDCDTDEVVLAKLTADYLIDQEKSLPASPNFTALPPQLFIYNPLAAKSAVKVIPIRGPTPPPLPFGRELLLRRQLFLC